LAVGEPDGAQEGWRATTKYLTYRGLGTVMSFVPESISRAVVGCVVRAMSWRGGSALAMNERHMRRILASECEPGVVPDAALVRRWSRRTYVESGRYWMDGARLPYVPADDVRARLDFEPDAEQIIRSAVARGRGLVLALPHVGSWEWGGAWLGLEGMPMMAIVERVEPDRLFDWFASQRLGMGLTVVPLGEGSSRAILKTLKDGGVVGLVCDRDLMGNGVEVEFFGERTTLPGGAATVALRTGAALVPVVVYSGPGDHHTVLCRPSLDTTRSGSLRADVHRLTQELATCFEDFILRRPEQWHIYQHNWPSDRTPE
jgi:KDO2-lipid IV(A) lauroyltransferase